MAPFQVDKMTVRGPAAFQNPVETNGKGEITGIVLSVPVFYEKNSFLVVRIPKNVVQDLIRSTAAKPESERAQFIRDWIKQNQLAIYDQYVASGGKATHFDYDLVPLTRLGVTPKLAEPPSRAMTPAKVEPPPRVFPAERQKEETAPAKRTMRIEEKPPEKPEEKVAFETPARRSAKIEVPPLPKGVRGNGSPKSPYQFSVPGNKESSGTGASEVFFPFSLKIPIKNSDPMPITIQAVLTLSQLKKDTRGDTETAIFQFCAGIIQHHVAENRHEFDNTVLNTVKFNIVKAVTGVIDQVIDKHPDTLNYLK